ncbi:ankyrin repeat-containing protein [Anaeramoeba ignava]|uniref:Ankyrin repeat-containing protein n=1 Tax=Anaeramoeba ignava TaxID=1746090 RepID=A0A9Q0RG37_ANAIG|nr:ankyrin repeat-containing protein [Anaeramoeba ignava]
MNSTSLFQLIDSQNFETLKSQLEKEPDLIKQTDGWNLLHYSCSTSNTENLIEFLISKGMEINSKTGLTPLHICCWNDLDISVFNILLKAGVDVNSESKITPLHLAAQTEMNHEKIKLLIDNGANIYARNNSTPLSFALQSKQDLETIKLLSSKEIIKSKNLTTSLHLVLSSNPSLEVVKFLIDNGADINSQDKATPLYYSIIHKNPFEIQELLLKFGADPNISSFSILLLITQNPSKFLNPDKEIELLIKYGAKIKDDNNNNYENSLLFNAINHSFSPKTVDLLLNLKPNIDIKNHSMLSFAIKQKYPLSIIEKIYNMGSNDVNRLDASKSPLFHSVFHDSVEVCEFLLKNKADPNQSKNLPLHAVCSDKKCLVDFADILIKYGADIEKKDLRKTPIQICCWSSKIFELVQLLISKGAQTNVVTLFSSTIENPKTVAKIVGFLFEKLIPINGLNKQTALHLAIATKKPLDSIESLLDYGAFIEIKDDQTPLSLANSEQKEFIDSYLSICEDMNNLLEDNPLADFTIYLNEGNLRYHKIILNSRIGEENIPKFLEIISTKEKQEVELFMKFIYSGLILNPHQYDICKEIWDSIGLNDLDKQIGKKSLISNLRKLENDENSKDFTILCENKEIRVHKFILFARSELFRGMFLNVSDDSNKVNDYSGRSFDSMNQLIHFFIKMIFLI